MAPALGWPLPWPQLWPQPWPTIYPSGPPNRAQGIAPEVGPPHNPAWTPADTQPNSPGGRPTTQPGLDPSCSSAWIKPRPQPWAHPYTSLGPYHSPTPQGDTDTPQPEQGHTPNQNIYNTNTAQQDTPRGGRPEMAGAVQSQLPHGSVGYGDDNQSSEDTGNLRPTQSFPMCR